MRVVHVNDYAPGAGSGAEVYLSRVVRGLEAAGHEVAIFSGTPRVGTAAKALDLWDPGSRRHLSDRLADFRPQVVHFHNVLRELSPSVYGAGGASVARVSTLHDHRLIGRPDAPVRGPRDVAKILSARFALRLARRALDATIVVSRALVEPARGAGLRDVIHIPVPAPSPPDPTPVETCHDVVFAGRLAPEKGVFQLLTAWGQIADRFPDSHLVMAGDGPARAALEERARRMDRVTFTGVVLPATVSELMASARTVVAPSVRSETAGLVVAEAALCGRPVIVSDEPALRELVDDSNGGIVVTMGSVPELAGAIASLLANPTQAAEMGRAGRTVAITRHNPQDVVRQISALYARVAAQRSS
jgi:glycosyltransferase involved in cell wall biosynthesis